MIRTIPRLLSVASIACALSACGSDAAFDVRYAKSYAPPKTVSVFGVFKDGRMNPEAWDTVAARFSSPLGGGPCAIAIGSDLALKNPSLIATLDDTTRENGVTDEVLAEFVPMAKSDLILLFTIAGHPPEPIPDSKTQRATPSSNRFSPGSGSSMSGMRGTRGMGAPPSGGRGRAPERSVFEISASLYSTREKASIGQIAMEYIGKSVDEAFRKFTERLAAELPGTKCVGWDLDAKVDEERLHALHE